MSIVLAAVVGTLYFTGIVSAIFYFQCRESSVVTADRSSCGRNTACSSVCRLG